LRSDSTTPDTPVDLAIKVYTDKIVLNVHSAAVLHMDQNSELLSPKQVALAIGVSESSLKRWCDSGRIPTRRTAGGHRRMLLADVVQFLRRGEHALVAPEVLSLPPVTSGANLGVKRGGDRLAEALLAGQEEAARRIVFDLYLAGQSLSVICDLVIAEAFHEIGRQWECHAADVFQERRGCEIAQHVLGELRRVLPAPDPSWTALGGTLSGDQYSLPSTMAELVLRDGGWNASSLGCSIPPDSMIAAVTRHEPKLFWLSVSHLPDIGDFTEQFQAVSAACDAAGSVLVVGGRALTKPVRSGLTFAAYCDTMQQLGNFARTLSRNWKSGAGTSRK
jgi:excisionase family DNA binding protein